MIQKIRTEKWSPEMHTLVHEKGEEHTHEVGNARFVYLDIEFDEKTATGYLEMYADHTFRLEGKTKPVVRFDIYSDGSISDSARAYISNTYVDFRNIAEKKMIEENTFHVKIEKELQEARAQSKPFSDEELKGMLAAKEVECQEYKKAYWQKKEQENKDREEKAAAEKAIKEAEDAKIAAEKEKRRLDRLEWAKQHGSDQLRKGLEQGYSCIKKYEQELGAFLLGDQYEYDRDDEVEAKNRSCPSMAALEELERLQKIEGIEAGIVWMPTGLSDLHKEKEEYNEPESGCEAVRADVKGTAGYWYKTF